MTDKPCQEFFYHKGIPYGQTAVDILKSGLTLSVSRQDKLTLADAEILDFGPEKYREIFIEARELDRQRIKQENAA